MGKHILTAWIAAAIAAAIVFAVTLPWLVGFGAENDQQVIARAGYLIEPLRIGGEIFLRLLKMVVVPLVMASVMTGILGMGDVRKLGRPGLVTVIFYLSTTVLAVIVGLILVNVIAPGEGTVDPARVAEIQAAGEEPGDDPSERTIGYIIENLILMLFTDNLVRSATETELLPLIAFSIVFAALLTTLGKKVDRLTTLIVQFNEALMALIMALMWLAPLGIFCLVAARFGEARIEGKLGETIAETGWYFSTVLIGLAIHAFITLPAILYLLTGRNPYRFLLQMAQALLTAFSTSSSSATLPVTIETAIETAGVSRRSTEFVVPLGATINMDGTALYEAVAAIFIAQVVGADLGLMQQVTVAVTATLAAIGAAGIPEAGLVTMVIVLTAVDLPVEQMGLIISVDWLLDRFRTTVNVFGDATGAAVVEKYLPDEPAAAVEAA